MSRRRTFAGATVVISGAGGGLGRALAVRFARAGSTIVALDRDVGALDSLAEELQLSGAEALVLPCDVTDAGACRAAIDAAVARFGRIDVLINNAGLTHRSPFADTDPAVLRRVIDVNLFGAIHLTGPALPALRRSRGLIVAISSVAGFTPLIARTGYAASKHALHGLFESLRTEVAADGIDVTLACPSFIATRIDRNALGARGDAASHPQVVVGRPLQADDVADTIFHGCERSKRLLLVGRTARAAWWLSRVAPALYARIMARRLSEEMAP
jgi:NAD(P)-dependent dehydrogenase (short-subunit alcohol dehydrogenase family)